MVDLPCDLLEEILSRGPATSLSGLRFTCKRWNALFKDPDFIKKHLNKAAKQNMVLMWSNFRVYSLSVNLKEICNSSIEFTAKLSRSLNKSEKVEIIQLFHCNGLLLCSTREARKTKLMVVNPCTGQTRWIKPRNMYDSRYAFGYENNNKESYESYKILRFPYDNSQLEIFELKSNSWRVLTNIHPDKNGYTNGRGVSLKGNAYWMSYISSILSFDFTTERFRRLRLPIPESYKDINITLSVVREEKISLLHKNGDTQKMEIWVCNNIDDIEISWSYFFTLDLCSQFDRRLGMSFLIDEVKKVVMTCGRSLQNKKNMIHIVAEHGGCRKFDYDTDQSDNSPPFLFSYVPTLVSLNPPM